MPDPDPSLLPGARGRRLSSGITEGGLRKGLWKLAFPMMLSGLLQDLFSLFDLFWVGRLGHLAVAALSVCGGIMSIMVMVTMGIGTGTTALVAHFVGSKDYERADNTVFQTLLMGAVASGPMVLLALFATPSLINLFGVGPEVASLATGYLKVNLAFSAFMFFSVGLSQALNGAGDAETPLKILAVTNLVNILLDPVLIFGLGPFPAMGVVGSAVATVFSRGLMTAMLMAHFLLGHSALHLNRRALKVSFPIMGRILSIGVFASMQVFLRQVSFIVLIRLVASFGAAALAAYGIANRLRFVVMVPGFGLANAGAVMVGQNMGADRPDRATRSGWETVKNFEVFAIPVAVVYVALAPFLVSVFSPENEEVVRIGATYLRFLALTFPFLAFSIVLSRALSGAGDTFAPAVMTALGQLGVRVSAAYWLAVGRGMGPVGIWLAINLSDVFQAALYILYFRSAVWQKQYHRHRSRLQRSL